MTLRFGTDGVRGVANSELTVELVTALGRAAVRVLGADTPFVVGRDTRRSGPMLEAALVAGMCAEGVDVALVGVLPTPGVAFLARERAAPAAVISASHNSFEDNGVKLFAAGGRKIPANLEAQVEAELRALATEMPETGASGDGVGVASEHRTALDDYVSHLVDALEGRRLDGVRLVIDCGNGAAFRSAPAAFRALGADVDVLQRVTRRHEHQPGVRLHRHEPAARRSAPVARERRVGLRRRRRPCHRGRRERRGDRRRPDARGHRDRPARPWAPPRQRRRRDRDVEPRVSGGRSRRTTSRSSSARSATAT